MINVKLHKSEISSKPFPKLMISSNGRIVIFYKDREGVVVKQSALPDSLPTGFYSESWDMSYFADYNEPITLQNA